MRALKCLVDDLSRDSVDEGLKFLTRVSHWEQAAETLEARITDALPARCPRPAALDR
jgi:hypothetical protein